MRDLKDQLDHLAETLELALEPLEAMARKQNAVAPPRPGTPRAWWIERRQEAQALLEQARYEVYALLLLCDDGSGAEVRNSVPASEGA